MTTASNNVLKTPPPPDLPWADESPVATMPAAGTTSGPAKPPATDIASAIAKAAGKAPAERKGAPTTVVALLSDPRIKAQIALAMPKHMTADRLARIALTEVRKTPALGKCDPASFLGALMQCAALGLEPGGSLGHAYLLPFNKRAKVDGSWKTVGTEAQFILGYRGMIDLARRSGQIVSLEARAVYAVDKFRVELGLHQVLEHVPAWDVADRGELKFVYAVARLVGGGVQFEVMSRVDVERVKAQSKAAGDGPWVSHFEQMALKTVIRRLFKYLPVSIEVQRATVLDEQAEAGLPQDLGDALTIDSETGEISGGDA